MTNFRKTQKPKKPEASDRSQEGTEENRSQSRDRVEEGAESQGAGSAVEAEDENNVSDHQSEEISADELKKGRWKLQYIPPDE